MDYFKHIVDSLVDLLRKPFFLIPPIISACVLQLALLVFFLPAFGTMDIFGSNFDPANLAWTSELIFHVVVAVTLYLTFTILFSGWVQAGILGIASRSIKKQEPTWARFAQSGRRYMWRYLGYRLLVGLVALFVLGLALVIVAILFALELQPWIIVVLGLALGLLAFVGLALLTLAFLFTPILIVERDLGIVAALEGSYRFLRERTGMVVTTALLALLLWVAVFVLIFFFQLPFSVASILRPESPALPALTIVAGIIESFLTVVATTAVYLFLIRVHRDGLSKKR